MEGAIIAYNPCLKCENKKMCEICEITYYRAILGTHFGELNKRVAEKE